jgi:DNA polymerase-3 subunit delta'
MNALPNLVGQSFARRILSSALASGRVASAYLFEGPPGCGKKTAALDLAAALVAPDDAAARTRVLAGIHPDVRSFEPAGATFKVEQTREILKECALRPVLGARRVFILDRVEAMNPAAANALLKSLEEPPSGLTWILVTTQRARILPTIASRCQSVRFHPLDQASLRSVLERKLQVDAVRARDLAVLGNGSVKLATWFAGEEGQAVLAQAEAFLEVVAEGSLPARLDWALAAAEEKQRSKLERLLGVLAVLLRERWARAKGLPRELYLLSTEPKHGRSLPPEALERMIEAVNHCRMALANNANLALALDRLCLAAERHPSAALAVGL